MVWQLHDFNDFDALTKGMLGSIHTNVKSSVLVWRWQGEEHIGRSGEFELK